MKIFEEDGKIRLQLMDTYNKVMLFDFKVAKKDFAELREHMVSHLLNYKLEL